MAIVGIGVDVVEVARIASLIERTPKFLDRVLTPAEKEYCFKGKKGAAQHVAGRFAVKEAVIKAIGHFVPWHSIEVLNESSGHPIAQTYPPAELPSGGRLSVSIAHERHYAIAFAILEVED